MSPYRIKDVAERSGFSAATLRYYEDIGLLPPAARTSTGYRQYDEQTIDRLAFIARAKQLGCSLEEITELNAAWDGGRCGPVQDGLRALVDRKLADARDRIVELLALTGDLQRAAASLERHRPDGPCDDRCGCTGEPAPMSATAQTVRLGRKPAQASAEVPVACTLPPAAAPGRLREWQEVLAHATDREAVDGGVRVVFGAATPLDGLARVVLAEQACCSFFAFAITVDERGLALEVRAPGDARLLVDALFGEAA